MVIYRQVAHHSLVVAVDRAGALLTSGTRRSGHNGARIAQVLVRQRLDGRDLEMANVKGKAELCMHRLPYLPLPPSARYIAKSPYVKSQFNSSVCSPSSNLDAIPC